MSVLEARGIAVAPPGTPDPVVRGVSLSVRAGEWVALEGPNGSGKTSVALALAGLLPVREGAVLLDGRPLAAGGAGREGLAMILQDPSVQLLQTTVADELAFTARNLGRPAAMIAASVSHWAERLALAGDLERDPRGLSAGRQQLVLLAAALVAAPRFLVADEPGAHLDPRSRAHALEVVREAVRGGLGVVWVTQHADELEAADRIMTLGTPLARALPAPAPPAAPAAAPVVVLTWGPPPESGPRVASTRTGRIEVAARGVTTLTGANGTGKSVLLGCAAGLLTLDQVRVAWSRAPEPAPLLVAEHPELTIVRERVVDEILDAATWRGVPRAEALIRARMLLERMQLIRILDSTARSWSLSSGEKRVVSLIGALVAPASLILLDEPTAGLDALRKGVLSDILREIGDATPILVASQDLPWIRSLGGKSTILDGHASDAPSLSKKTD